MYIYIVSHPKFKEWIKLGRAKDVNARMSGYQTGCPYRSYKLEFSIETKYYYNIETYFINFVKGNGFEWYNCSVEFAINEINIILKRISENENYFKQYGNKDNVIYAQKQNTNVKRDYIVDGIIYHSVRELANYIGMNTLICGKEITKQIKLQKGNNYIEIGGFKITIRKHEKQNIIILK